MTERRICSLWLPRLTIEHWGRTNGVAPDELAERALVLTVEAPHGLLIHAASEAALARGARIGGRLTDARALDPELAAVPADLSADSKLISRLARWAARWSPLVEADGSNSLRLDVTGVAHLFGGERALAVDIRARLAGIGYSSALAIAPTAGAAWGLARYGGRETTICPSALTGGELAECLAPLPVAALRLGARETRTLVRLGLKTVGDLAGVPRKGLARRFRESDHPLDALDRALGRKPEPLTAAPLDLPPRALLRLKEPVTHPEAAPQAFALLVPILVAELETRRLGVRRLALSGYRVDGSVALASVATSIPSREPTHLKRLLADHAATLDPEFGFDAFALEASWWEPLDPGQQSLVGETGGETEVARLVDRLSVKLGPDKVRRPAPRESHLPERANGWETGVDALPSTGGQGTATGQLRPHKLLDWPEAIGVIYATPEGLPRRFSWRRAVHDIARAQGPERIAPEWWRERASARLRDYYKVEDSLGRRFWIFREGLVGDGRGGPPQWFIHGLFG